MSEQPVDGPDTAPADDDMHSRDLGTLASDGPQLTQFETPRARWSPGRDGGPGVSGGQAFAEGHGPHYSPVAQPGMIEEIHWHTVRSEEGPAARQPPPGRRRRGRGRGPGQTIILRGGGRRRGRRGGGQ